MVFLFQQREGSRTHRNATQASVAREGLTEGNLNFANGKMQIDSRIPLHVKALFCDIAKVTLLQYPAGRVILILKIRQERGADQ